VKRARCFMHELVDYRSLYRSLTLVGSQEKILLEHFLFPTDSKGNRWPPRDPVDWDIGNKCVDDEDYADPPSDSPSSTTTVPTSDLPLRVFLEQLNRESQERKRVDADSIKPLPHDAREAMVEKAKDFLLKFLGYMAGKRKRKRSLAMTDVQEGHDPWADDELLPDLSLLPTWVTTINIARKYGQELDLPDEARLSAKQRLRELYGGGSEPCHAPLRMIELNEATYKDHREFFPAPKTT